MEKSGKYNFKLKSIVLALLFGCAIFACVGEIGGVLLTEHANRLLMGDSGKLWLRMQRLENGTEIDINSCDENQGLTFDYDATAKLNTVFKTSNAFNCSNAVVLWNANYEPDGNLDDHFEYTLTLSNTEQTDIETMEVLDITSQYLRLRYTEAGVEVIEVYTFE